MWLVLKYLMVFGLGLFLGWFFFSPLEEELVNSEEVLVPEPQPLSGRNPIFRAATSARPPSGKEPS